MFWLVVFLLSPAVLCHLGQGDDLTAFGICVSYPMSYWVVISYSPSVRGWLEVCLKLQSFLSCCEHMFILYLLICIKICRCLSQSLVLPPEHIYSVSDREDIAVIAIFAS